jgi:hypothetical protein
VPSVAGVATATALTSAELRAGIAMLVCAIIGSCAGRLPVAMHFDFEIYFDFSAPDKADSEMEVQR